MIRIIPAIDIIDGKCVRLTKGDYSTKKVYADDPVQMAQIFEAAGMRYLHLVDLDGAREKKIVNQNVLREIAANTSLSVDFGGGIQSDQDLAIAFDNGAHQITAGSIAVRNQSNVLAWLEKYGPEKIIIGADVREDKIAVSGWQEQTELDIWSFLDVFVKAGIKYSICTDISRDGMLQGTAINLYKSLSKRFPDIKFIASGGITSLGELSVLEDAGIEGVIIGKAIYEGKINLKELEPFLC
jgi:phosphoribosylformimino-5-aminoimidazole carboxamide ribotide isomerase